ncbi:G5 domain-containing protein [[Brevibacterium] frigoritolerans]|uniref:G5 domain-containing protein n=1 Tax=Peribacillus frigoritolerans TaxID=450367 RepID=A0A941FGN1_9BACI|nr:G5 domain-containing protein [Peribacillus frigoritolerans]
MVEREVLKEERIPFEKKVKEDDELPKGELITEQMGNEGFLRSPIMYLKQMERKSVNRS